MCTKLAKPEFCPIGCWVKWYIAGEDHNGNKLLMTNTITKILTSRVFMMYTPPNSGKVRRNWHMVQLRWGTNDM